MELDGTFWGACACVVVVCMRVRGWRAHLFPGSCSKPMSCRQEIGRDVLGCVCLRRCVYAVYGMAGSPVSR